MSSVGKYKPFLVNLQTNSGCPLKCGHCYKECEATATLDALAAEKIIDEARELGTRYINILGGEPFLYPGIEKIVKTSSEKGVVSHIATSGFGLDERLLKRLLDAGLGRLFVSLDGSNEKINALSREGFKQAAKALETAGKLIPDKSVALWVFTSRNAADFEEYLNLLEKLSVRNVCVLKLKKFSRFDPSLIPSLAQTRQVRSSMERRSDKFNFYPDAC